jgi:aminotransferase
MPRTSRRTSVFTESLIREMTRVAQQQGAINLSQGFPDFNPPRVILEAAKAEMDTDHHQYAITWGAPPLRQALAAKLARFTGLPCDPDRHLIVTCGATEAMMVAVMTVTDVGDRIGLFSPFYENYSADAILSGVTPVFATLQPPHYTFDLAELRRVFASGIKAFILCNPSNPTGKVFTPAELEQVAALAREYDVFIITDEVYEHIVFAPHRHTYLAALPGMAERTIQCSSLSKTFAITGWRLGYVFADPAVVAQGRKVHDFLTVGAAAPLQHAIVGRAAAAGLILCRPGPRVRRAPRHLPRLPRPHRPGVHPAAGFVLRDARHLALRPGQRRRVRPLDDQGDRRRPCARVGLLPRARAPLRPAQLRQAPRDPARRRRAAAETAARLSGRRPAAHTRQLCRTLM